jgi:hypothetical protein
MQLANTQTVRNIVNYIVGTSARYTDRGTNNTRLLAWEISECNANAYVKEIQEMFALAGFSNRIKVTNSAYTSLGSYRTGGQTWLRINASFIK